MSQLWIDQNPAPSGPVSHEVVQAGFWRRWAALFLDQLILSGVFYALIIAVALMIGATGGLDTLELSESEPPPAWVIALYVGVTGLYYLGAGLYFSLMESSVRQATVGKMALGIKVVDQAGQRLSFAHALGRWFAASLSYLTLYIGFFMAALTAKKQALHDLMANTLVVDKWAYTDSPERQTRGPTGCLVAFAVAIALMIGLVVLGVVAAIALPAYQQYTAGAQFEQLEARLVDLTAQVKSHYDDTGRCPDNTANGFGPAGSYADSLVSRVVVGEFEVGFCGISVWMPPLQGSIERQFLVEFDPDDAIWYCTDKAGITTLPGWCH